MEQNIIPWVKGNTLPIAVPLQTKTSVDGKWVFEDYYPPADSEIHVFIVGSYNRREYGFTLDGNVVRITDNGQLSVGDYGIEITIKEPTDFNRRTFKCKQIHVNNCTDELGELPEGEAILDAAIFIQGQKGDKGDPFVYEDFTPEQIAELQRPATEAAAEVAELERTISGHEEVRELAERERNQAEIQRGRNEEIREYNEGERNQSETLRGQNETLRQQNEQTRSQNEGTRQQNEQTRSQSEQTRSQNESTRQEKESVRQQNETYRERTFGEIEGDYSALKEDYAEVKQDAQRATSDANDAAGHAEEKADLANSKAQYAEQKGDYAKDQGDYAKRKAEEIEDAKGSYQTLDDRLDAMDDETGAKLDAPTQEEFDAIFN